MHRAIAWPGWWALPRATDIRAIDRAAGFTLVEVLIAISLMAVLAVMCWRGLEAVVSGRDRILQGGEQMQALSTLMAQLDEDLNRSQPLRRVLGRDPILLSRTPAGALLALERPVPGQSTGLVQHVEWRVDAGRLQRGYAAPENPLAPGAARTMVWQTLLEPVEDWRVRILRRNLRRQWLDAQSDLGGTANPGDIIGLEFAIVQGGQTLTRILAVED